MKLVKVVWEDVAEVDTTTWVFREGLGLTEPMIFHQVGWLVEHTPDAIVLTSCVGDELIGPRCRIPVGMIKSLIGLIDGEPIQIVKKKPRKSPLMRASKML